MIIGLSGYSGAGKDAVGLVLVEEHGFTRVAFADALKTVLWDLDPFLDEYSGSLQERFADVEAAKSYAPVRRYLQRLGVACRVHLGPEVWVDAVRRQLDPGGDWVITDVRFPNEAAMVTAEGGEMWRIERPGCAPVNSHISETALDEHTFDRWLYNDQGLDWLAFLVDRYVKAD